MFNLFIDGWGLAGKVSDFSLPQPFAQPRTATMVVTEWTPKLMMCIQHSESVSLTLRKTKDENGSWDSVRPEVLSISGKLMIDQQNDDLMVLSVSVHSHKHVREGKIISASSDSILT